MNYDLMDFEMDDWDDEDEDEILYESEEFANRHCPPNANEPIISDDLPVLPLRVVIYPMMCGCRCHRPGAQHPAGRNTLPNNRIIALVTSKNEKSTSRRRMRFTRSARRRRCTAC